MRKKVYVEGVNFEDLVEGFLGEGPFLPDCVVSGLRVCPWIEMARDVTSLQGPFHPGAELKKMKEDLVQRRSAVGTLFVQKRYHNCVVWCDKNGGLLREEQWGEYVEDCFHLDRVSLCAGVGLELARLPTPTYPRSMLLPSPSLTHLSRRWGWAEERRLVLETPGSWRMSTTGWLVVGWGEKALGRERESAVLARRNSEGESDLGAWRGQWSWWILGSSGKAFWEALGTEGRIELGWWFFRCSAGWAWGRTLTHSSDHRGRWWIGGGISWDFLQLMVNPRLFKREVALAVSLTRVRWDLLQRTKSSI